MRKISILDRILLLAACILAAYQVVIGIEGLESISIASYTIGFGALLIAGLLLIILGFEILESPHVVIVSTIIPLSVSVGLVAEFFPQSWLAYIVIALLGFFAVVTTRYLASNEFALITLVFVHGIAGIIIFALPIMLVFQRRTPAGFVLVSIGGALIGLFGLLLSFLKTGKPLLSQDTILSVLPVLLLVVTAGFVVGFAVL